MAASTNICEMLRLKANAFPHRNAVVSGCDRISYSELYDQADAVARRLISAGLCGQRVAVLLPTCPDLVVLYYACFMAGVTILPLNYSFRSGEVNTVLKNSSPLMVVVSPCLHHVVAECVEAASTIRHLFVTGNQKVGHFLPFSDFLRSQPDASLSGNDRSAVVFHTSGTTGVPKGVCHTLASASCFAHRYLLLCEEETNPTTLISRNCYHSGGFFHLTGALSAGTTCVLDDTGRFQGERYLQRLQEHSVTQMFVSVSMLNAILRVPGLSREAFRYASFMSVGADRVTRQHHEAIRRYTHLPMSVRYSSTEATCVSINASSDDESRMSTVGYPFSDFEWRLSNLTNARVGELLLRGQAVFQGYDNNAPATESAFTSDGWYQTCDLFRDTGNGLEFIGRNHGAIKVGGKVVTPQEIEVVANQYPDFEESIAVGVPHNIEVEVPLLFAQMRNGASFRGMAHFERFMKERIAQYKIPVLVHIVNEIPLNSGGKADRAALRRLAAKVFCNDELSV